MIIFTERGSWEDRMVCAWPATEEEVAQVVYLFDELQAKFPQARDYFGTHHINMWDNEIDRLMSITDGCLGEITFPPQMVERNRGLGKPSASNLIASYENFLKRTPAEPWAKARTA